jgi:hypothetical protein
MQQPAFVTVVGALLALIGNQAPPGIDFWFKSLVINMAVISGASFPQARGLSTRAVSEQTPARAFVHHGGKISAAITRLFKFLNTMEMVLIQ